MSLAARILILTLGLAPLTLAAKPSVKSILAEMIPFQYTQHLAKLSGYGYVEDGKLIPDRFSPEGLAMTRKYIKDVLKGAGFAKIERENFSVAGNRLGRWSHGVNYYVEIPGCKRPDEIIVVGAHYDSAGLRIRGANDNASGAAAVLMLAETLMVSGACPERTIRFLLQDGEELGYYGSIEHFSQAALRGEDIQLFINLDMIAYPLTKHSTLFYDARGWQEKLRPLMESASRAMPRSIRMQPFPGPRVYRSDHNSGDIIGFPAVGLVEHVRTSDGRTKKISPNYHTTKDRIWELDMDYAFNIVQYLTALTIQAANSEERWAGKKEVKRQTKYCEKLLRARLGLPDDYKFRDEK